MKILLINNNPVVSRLTALSARKEGVELDEIKDISELKNSDYNIIFVDLDSFTKNTANVLKNSNIKKRVCFYTQDDKEIDNVFNFEILKPFLPSEVSAIIRETKIEIEKEEENQKQKDKNSEQNLDLDELISTKKDDLEPIKIEKDIKETKEEIKKEVQKDETQDEILDEINLAKEQIEEIKKEGLELFEQEEPIKIQETETKEPKTEKLKTENIKKEINQEKDIEDSELFELDKDKDNNKEEDINNEIFVIETKEEESTKEDSELFNFDIESQEEINFEPVDNNIDSNKEDKNNTKILDKDEISNIKNLLNEKDVPENLSLEDIMTPPNPLALADKETKKKKKKKKKIKKIKEIRDIKENIKEEDITTSTEVITKTIQAMPVEELRQLLRGTKIHITIEFPNDI